MLKCFRAAKQAILALWKRVHGFLLECADRHVATWAASLQMRRRYTHPDEAKRYRRKP
jgi:hypothetical protein